MKESRHVGRKIPRNWIMRDFARRMDLRGRILANLRRSFHACRPTGLSVALSSVQLYQDGYRRLHVAAPHGIVETHPFFDRRIFSVGLGMHSRIRPQLGGQKPILAAAMRGILPECILNRPSKGHFNEAYYTGLSRNLRYLETLIEEAPDELGLFDKGLLLDCVQRAALGNTGDAGSLSQFNSTLSLLLWLTREHAVSGQRERILERVA
jgi:asparagine synthase (glutamine-hydrolysing)